MNQAEIDENVTWYREKQPLYKILAEKVIGIIEEVIISKNINYASLGYRDKDIESFRKKIESGINFDPKEMQDLAGIRIVGYVKSDVDNIAKEIENLFEIDKARSVDKAESLGTDKMGYRSIHFVAKLPKNRIELSEFRKFEGLSFEIQIRTILQHAWAEIQHDRNYKFSGVLPNDIKRRFSLLAGHLELADNEFDTISRLLENYSENVSRQAKAGKLDIHINSTSLRQFLIEKFGDIQNIEQRFGPKDDGSPELIQELESMGINTLDDLNKIIPKKFKEILQIDNEENNFIGVVRDIMIIHDTDSYFKKAWKKHWRSLSKLDTIYSAYNIDVQDLSKKYGIDLY